MIGIAVYVLCAGTALACAILLGRGYKKTGLSLLFWSAMCFAGLTLSNCLLVVDLVFLPERDLSLFRNSLTLASAAVLLYSLISEMTS